MRCLVTGASGHLGSYLTQLLLSRDHEVAILARPETDLWRLASLEAAPTIVRGDLASIESARKDVALFAPEVVFHLAWHGVPRPHRNDPHQIDYNLVGSLKLLEISREAGCRCWIGIGSQAEYGPHNKILTEDLPLRPMTIYGATKVSVGVFSRVLCELADMRWIWLRLLAIYGPKDNAHRLIPSAILKLLAREELALTDGGQCWDYLYVQDAAEAVYQIAMDSAAEGVFNLASGEVRTVRSIVEQISDLIGLGRTPTFGELSSDQVTRVQADVTHLQGVTGWRPRTGLEEGLRQTIGWFRANSWRYVEPVQDLT